MPAQYVYEYNVLTGRYEVIDPIGHGIHSCYTTNEEAIAACNELNRWL